MFCFVFLSFSFKSAFICVYLRQKIFELRNFPSSRCFVLCFFRSPPNLRSSAFIPHSRCSENSMVDLSERPGANPQGMPKLWQQKILYRNQKANLSKPHGSTNLLFSKKSPMSGPMCHQISKMRSVSQEQNTPLKSQNPGNVGLSAAKNLRIS